MNPQVSFKFEDGLIKVFAPYSTRLLPEYKARGGKFDYDARAWIFPDCHPVRYWIAEFWGYYPGCGIKEIEVTEADWDSNDVYGRAETILPGTGYLLASRNGRDRHAVLTPGCALVDGGFSPSGGSVKHPAVAAQSGTAILVAVYDGLHFTTTQKQE